MNAKIYSLKDEEISPDTWIVEIAVSYKYEGTLSPIGPSNGEWIDVLYQASLIGFLMTKEGNSYSLQSRYAWLFFCFPLLMKRLAEFILDKFRLKRKFS